MATTFVPITQRRFRLTIDVTLVGDDHEVYDDHGQPLWGNLIGDHKLVSVTEFPTAGSRFAALQRRVQEQHDWIAQCGGDLAGYRRMYDANPDPIYDADQAELVKRKRALENFINHYTGDGHA